MATKTKLNFTMKKERERKLSFIYFYYCDVITTTKKIK